MFDGKQLTLLLYIMARVSGFILFNPLTGRKNIPGIIKAGVIMVLSVFTLSFTVQPIEIPSGLMMFAIHVLLEVMVGFLLGTAMQFFFYIPQMAGFTIDLQMGLTMNQIYDAGSQANLSVTSIIINILMTLLFFVSNGHHTLFRIFLTSGEGMPYGAVILNLHTTTQVILEIFVECTLLAVKLSLPILVAELLGQLGMGILMKVIPQINVFSINIELKMIIGLVMVLVMIAPFSEFLLQTEVTMLKRLEQILQLMGA